MARSRKQSAADEILQAYGPLEPDDMLRLYDAIHDPGEASDVGPTHTDDVTRLKRDAEEWLASRRPSGETSDDHRLSARAVESLKALGYIQ